MLTRCLLSDCSIKIHSLIHEIIFQQSQAVTLSSTFHLLTVGNVYLYKKSFNSLPDLYPSHPNPFSNFHHRCSFSSLSILYSSLTYFATNSAFDLTYLPSFFLYLFAPIIPTPAPPLPLTWCDEMYFSLSFFFWLLWFSLLISRFINHCSVGPCSFWHQHENTNSSVFSHVTQNNTYQQTLDFLCKMQ